MQDEVTEEMISVCIKGGKITGQILMEALRQIMNERKKHKAVCHGKQNMKKLMAQNCKLSNIEVTDGNIKSFERYARKYNIDFSLKKDTSVCPSRYFVFFKARDADVMTAAFKEYTKKNLDKDKEKRPSVMKKLDLSRKRTEKHMKREKIRQKERGLLR